MPESRPRSKLLGSDGRPPQAIVGGAAAAPLAAEPYWASDGRHYVVVNGAWAYDYFRAAHNDTNGQPVPGEIGIYRATDNVEAFVFDTNLVGYTAFRDLSNPLFNVVHWVAWPNGQPATTSNMIYKVTLDQSTFVWFNQNDFSNIVNSGLGQRIGFDQPAPTSLWEDWTQHATNTNGVLFGESLNHTWVQPNCAYGCTTY